MPRSAGQKLKLLYLKDYLLRYTDDSHSVTVRQMIEELGRRGISAERKSVYDDLDALDGDACGLDLVRDCGSYAVGARDFELQEVKLLVDMVQSSNFITRRKTAQLITKLEGLCSRHEARLLSRQVYVRNRVKAMNESVYINVDKISEAIAGDRLLRFLYFQYNTRKQKELRHAGRLHEVSPFALIWVDQNYYLLAYSAEHESMRHYRVDRMTRITSAEGPRRGKEVFAATDMSTYTTKVFNMFTGEEKRVRLRCDASLADPFIDRFGEDVSMVPEGEDAFTVTVDVVVSPQFYAWLTPFGTRVEILNPPEVREGFRRQLKALLTLYE